MPESNNPLNGIDYIAKPNNSDIFIIMLADMENKPTFAFLF